MLLYYVSSCGSMTHDAKSCFERARKVGSKFTGKHIAADEKIESVELDYAGKRDRWNGYETSQYCIIRLIWGLYFLSRCDWMTHEAKSFFEREREVGAKFTWKHITAD